MRALGAPATTGIRLGWTSEVRRTIARLRRQRRRLWEMSWRPCEGDGEILLLEIDLGRLAELLRRRGSYDRSFITVENAAWRRPVSGYSDRSPG
jgi:hypothetical protein